MNKIFQLVFILSFGICYCQINVEEIKKNVTENPQKYYYDHLEVFKTDPKSLSQEQLNYIYYGNNYVDYGYRRGEFNKQLNEITKFADRKISSKKASEVLEKAIPLYQKNPINKELLTDLSDLYKKTGDLVKGELHSTQLQLLHETIKNSGTGKLDNSPIVVTNFSDQLYAIEQISDVFFRGISFDTKVLPDGSWLNIFKNGIRLFFVKTVHHKDMYKDDK
ncbi:uncharacterized protein DUF4919 [Chryseobacterium sp. 52]|uniref:DUF4919 domain-containing protein n=1 Tax=Chryseobacterium sp. 52 TaxID=2035213 RepID=UPI000C1904AE|nr:DUF4919 domain-containing protein [Chryseobacterium sp. 52]PIF43668.1 uncharacterized protein DUF4919 [Chryseobacterium sp. 52]